MSAFETWWEGNKDRLFIRTDSCIAEEAWQAAQHAEREKTKELVEALKEIIDEDDRFAIPGNPVGGIARAAIAKYEESNEPT